MLALIDQALAKNNLKTPPRLSTGNRYGSTGYIDYFKAEDLTHSIMQGYDAIGRRFVAIKVDIRDKKTGETSQAVGTFFERHTSDSTTWAFGTCYPLNIIHHDSRVRESQYSDLGQRLTLLFGGGELSDIDGWKEPVDYVKGNGELSVKLAAV
jgi:hypothetical protein